MKPTNRVRELRLRRDLTQEELAKLVGSSQGNISKIESGRNDLMDADLIVKLSRALRVQPWELFVGGSRVQRTSPHRKIAILAPISHISA